MIAGDDRLIERCREALRRWRAPSVAQGELQAEYLRVCADDQAWSRACSPTHLTASALILSDEGDRVLLVLHGRVGRWLQTGGHVEASDVDLASAALREAGEESGLDCSLDPEPLLLSRHRAPCTGGKFHLDVQFLARADASQPGVLSPESDEVRWFAFDDLPELDDSVRDLISAARARLTVGVESAEIELEEPYEKIGAAKLRADSEGDSF